jgi:hypothetical protein
MNVLARWMGFRNLGYHLFINGHFRGISVFATSLGGQK